MQPADFGSQNTGDRHRLQGLADQLEAAWRAAVEPDLAGLLPPAGDPLRRAALVELVKTDLEIRWRRGRPVTLDDYLARHPELGPADELPADLVYEEFRVRSRHGDRPALESYRVRFPRQFAEVERLHALSAVPTSAHATATPAPPEAPPGGEDRVVSVGGGYRLVKLIGSGGFGQVWRAVAPGGFPAAVKIVHRPADNSERQREERALEVVKNLTHHFLLRTHGYHSEHDRLLIVMDLADGSLRDRLRACREAGQPGIPAAELLGYFREAAEALDYLHAKEVLHRDIKPDNILLVEGHVRLADFGLVRHQDHHLMTVSGSGTPAYMAPEVWRGKAGKASDQYALAFTYAELRMGRRPFSATDYAGVMFDHLDHTPDLAPLSAPERAVLLRAMAKKPEDRYASCGEFVRALEAAVASGGSGLTYTARSATAAEPGEVGHRETMRRPGPPPDVFPEPATLGAGVPARSTAAATAAPPTLATHVRPAPPRRRRLVPLAAAVLLFGGAAAAAVWLARRTPGPEPGPPVNVPPVVPSANAAKSKSWLPADCRPAGDEKVNDTDGRAWYRRVVWQRAGSPEVPFVVVPRQDPADPPTFYLMEHKVWNDLMATFAAGDAQVSWRRPEGADAGRLPALNVRPADARRFAAWLGGALPSARQWDRAAGLSRREGRDGPARGPAVAVGRRGQGPLPVGTAPDDVAPCGARDLAGNGWELTRDTVGDPPARLVILRGQRYSAAAPLRYADLDYQQATPNVQLADRPSPFTGFRVVLEAPGE